ncbi:uncharacterized protein At3g17950 [Impatiens glandulifera]|uniref:uncharacterized protein At3g17950 n=1 Tax=Impatiens glandulifera TaxID=253017 RepID=UPI001FB1978F|nr:uncharacterized protein At3g17950 [Impatiens glandulifera]
MFNPATGMLPFASSPTNSSLSSSDLDTESTGSFFHDRSTTLGTLMGVNYPSITFRVPSQRRDQIVDVSAVSGGSVCARRRSKKKAADLEAAAADRRKRKWWRFCRDDGSGPSSLGEFLEVERRFDDGGFYGEVSQSQTQSQTQSQPSNGRLLFADGRVLPPASSAAEEEVMSPSFESLRRFSVSLTGICNCGVY